MAIYYDFTYQMRRIILLDIFKIVACTHAMKIDLTGDCVDEWSISIFWKVIGDFEFSYLKSCTEPGRNFEIFCVNDDRCDLQVFPDTNITNYSFTFSENNRNIAKKFWNCIFMKQSTALKIFMCNWDNWMGMH